jgi:hypothetical protein
MTDVHSHMEEHRGLYGTSASQARGSSDFVQALQDSVRQNPISAALIGMGVLWMFMGGSNTSLFGGGGRKSVFRAAARGGDQMVDTIGGTTSSIGSSIGQAASQGANDLRRASAVVGEMASRTTGQAVDAVASAYDTTTDAASRAAETISKATTTAAHAVQETGTRWSSTVQQNIADLFERQPLLLGAVGLAIGAGIAASIPTTEAENKVMGEASDFVRETVAEKTAQVKEQVQDMADAALQGAKAQGITPEAAGGALRTVGDKVGAVIAQAAATSPSTKNTSRGGKKI